jgi:hypothetical protein
MTRVHFLKCWPESFEPLVAGFKKLEFRRDDRGYQVGDVLDLREYVPESGEPGKPGWKSSRFTGRRVLRGVTYVLRGPAFGVPEGFCILSLSGAGESPT